MPPKTDKQIIRRKKFIQVEIPLVRSRIEIIGESPEQVDGRTIKLDLTRQLKGKSIEMIAKIRIENKKAVAYPVKIKLLSYFIRRMIRKRISYVEDSFVCPTQESLIKIKPFLITKRRVSRRIRKTLRNRTNNWIKDYVSEKKDYELFSEILSNKMQKSLSIYLKKTYPLSLCEIRNLEIIRELKPEEIPKIEKKKNLIEETETVIDQLKEIEEERIKKAEKEIEETQKKAVELGEEKPKKSAKTKKSVENTKDGN